MNIYKTGFLGLMAGALALSTTAQAQTGTMDNPTGGTMSGSTTSTDGTMAPMPGGTMSGGTMSGGTMSGGTMSGGTMPGGTMSGGTMPGDAMSGGMMAPMPVTGTVLRYYVDRAGFVSAMDVQAADGVKMVQFPPSMAQRLTGTYPVGSQITGYVTSSGTGTMMTYSLAGLGADMPSPTSMMMPTSVTDLDLLRSEPYIMLGGKSMRTVGKLTGYVPDPNTGDVLALILDQKTLVRVPLNNRLPQASMAPEGVTALFKNSDVVAYGYEEAPRYGVVSPFAKRVVATGLSVNGRTVGAFGFGRVSPASKGTLLKFNLNFFGGAAPREVQANRTGFSPYMAPGDTMSGGMTGGTMDSTGGMTSGTGTMSGGADTSGGTMSSGGTTPATPATPGM